MNKTSLEFKNIREINEYNTQIKNLHNFYLLILKFMKQPDNGLIIDNSYLQNLEKHFRTQNQMPRSIVLSKYPSTIFKYLSNKMEIYTLSYSDKSK
jgi:hypothetical protein